MNCNVKIDAKKILEEMGLPITHDNLHAVQKQAGYIADRAIQDHLRDYLNEDFKLGRSDLSKDSVCQCLNCTRKGDN